MISPADYQEDIYRAARQASTQYGGRLETDDIAQAISLDMLRNPKRYDSVGGSLFFIILRRAGLRYCAEESARFLAFSQQHIYSANEVKSLLKIYYTPEAWPNGLSQPLYEDYGDVEAFTAALDTWNGSTRVVVDMLDLEYAIERVSEAQRRVIEKKYRDKEKLRGKYEANKHGEAIRYLTYHINNRVNRKTGVTNHEGPGARERVSNARAVMVVANQHRADGGGRDVTDTYQWHQRRNNPLHRRSKYVTSSPWR